MLCLTKYEKDKTHSKQTCEHEVGRKFMKSKNGQHLTCTNDKFQPTIMFAQLKWNTQITCREGNCRLVRTPNPPI